MTGPLRLPDFLVIGAVKAGTTWLWHVLRNHPGLYLPANRKELRFFNERWREGVDWYASWFVSAGDRVAGEVSPEYLHFEPAAERVHAVVPDVKLIAVLRDPVERAFSHVRMHCKRGTVAASKIDDAVLQPLFLEPGFYGKHIARYLDIFPRKQLLVLRFEDLMADNAAGIGKILACLEVDLSVQLPVGRTPPVNRARYAPRSRLAQRVLGSVDRAVRRSLGRVGWWDRLGRSPLAGAIQRAIEGVNTALSRRRHGNACGTCTKMTCGAFPTYSARISPIGSSRKKRDAIVRGRAPVSCAIRRRKFEQRFGEIQRPTIDPSSDH